MFNFFFFFKKVVRVISGLVGYFLVYSVMDFANKNVITVMILVVFNILWNNIVTGVI